METKETLYELQDCPACREGAGLMEHEGGWCCYVTCMDCGAQTAHFAYHNDAERAEAEKKATGEVMGPDPACPGGHLVRVSVANRTMESYSVEAPFPLRPRDILRAYRPEQDLGRTL